MQGFLVTLLTQKKMENMCQERPGRIHANVWRVQRPPSADERERSTTH